MRDARRAACRLGLAALLLAQGVPALHAQNYPNGLSTDSVDPRADAQYIREVRRRLDQVRTEQKRPTVALVLSGGGAKGAAEVGAIKYIEEMGIPIDFVCGTSIGGLVGGMYALGSRADDLAKLYAHNGDAPKSGFFPLPPPLFLLKVLPQDNPPKPKDVP